LFNTAFRRNRFDYQNARIIARLEPMPAVIGNTLYSDNAQVLTHALKAAVCITKCPVKSVDKSLPVYVRQMMAILEQSGNTESEVAQGALKAFATIIRDCPAAHIKEKDLVRLLEIITPDIEEIGRQASVFAMLRAIVSRKFVVPEIYDVMDKVAEIVVTNQSAQVQESCRAILLQFLLEYPQGKGRLTNQLTFLAKNLSYVHESGRKSVMELLGAVVSKFNATLLYQHTDLLFVALVMVLANDESSKCREMGASLLQSLLMRLDDERRRSILGYLRSWTGQRERLRLCSVSAQVYGLYLDAFHADAADQQTAILDSLKDLLALGRWDDDSEETTEDRWRISYQALVTAGKLTRDFPGTLTDHSGLPWNLIIEDLLYPHTWVRTAAARVVAQLFAVTPANGSEVSNDLSPLSSSDHRRIAELSCEQLKSDNLDETLSLQVVKNLFYLGKRFAAVPLPAVESTELGEGEVPEEAGDVVVDPAVDDMEEHSGAHPLPWLFSRLSYQLRSAHIARRSRSTARVGCLYIYFMLGTD
jgi:U3 small nucleolar RNA-associated protein 20